MTEEREKQTMPALVFEMKLGKLMKAFFRGRRKASGYWKLGGPVGIKEVPIPKLVADDWVRVKTVYCGICGSDMKEVTLSGARDNPIQSLISFPQIMGHEPVGIIDKVGSKVKNLLVGDRVAISPWFPCKPRGVLPECSRCQVGDFTHCHNFQKGQLPPGMHLGVTTGFGGFAPYIAVHESQCFIIPEGVSFEQAIVADPFSVAFHACLMLEPKPEQLILVYGLGVIGLLTILCLRNIFNVKRIVAVGRYPFQKEMAIKLGAEHVFTSSGNKLIEEIARYTNSDVYTPDNGLIWMMDGVDGIIDNIAAAETLEVGTRVLTCQGRLVFPGVNTPKRCESTVHYFKEIEVIGSNAFSMETFNGKRAHAFEFFLEFLKEKKFDTKLFLTQNFPLNEYPEAFHSLAMKNNSKSIKVAFQFF